jgi:hypothetical protein
LNELNRYLLIFHEEISNQLGQDEIIKTLDQAKDLDPEWHEAMVNAFLKFLMNSMILISSIWKTWRRSGAPTVQIMLHYQWIIRNLLPVI